MIRLSQNKKVFAYMHALYQPHHAIKIYADVSAKHAAKEQYSATGFSFMHSITMYKV